MYQEIVVIEDGNELVQRLEKIFKNEKDYIYNSINSENLEEKIKTIPDLIIINEDNIKNNIIDICDFIRKESENSITPIVVVSSDINKEHRIEILKSSVEYFIKVPIDEDYFYYTIKNIIRLMASNRKVSPLTGLPGNLQIQVELRKKLLKKEKFAILYFDLDNFKEYNDTYGFLKGDEVIKYTAKTILKTMNAYKLEDSFVGHIGGDDFVGIISNVDYEKLCQEIISKFDEHITDYLNQEDIERGYLEVANRRGIIEQFPITSISIGVVIVEPGEYSNPLEIGEVGAQVKHLAKTQSGSAYAINRRKG
jgi:diguanylate cyclase (GGDEF)-like protein